MIPPSNSFFGISRDYQAILRDVGLDQAHAIFTDPRIIPWRTLPERENCTFDAFLPDGRPLRLHIKRHQPVRGKPPGEAEADAILALKLAGIPTVPLVAWGKLDDGRSFLITEDLAGFTPADRLIAGGTSFEHLLEPTADLAARLHSAHLHHRDLYLCHFFIRETPGGVEVRLIDPGRVRHLPLWPFRQRWIVKDLAQFWFSALQLSIEEPRRAAWLDRYARQRGLSGSATLRWRIERKSARIARHDQRLRAVQPSRNISIPQPGDTPS